MEEMNLLIGVEVGVGVKVTEGVEVGVIVADAVGEKVDVGVGVIPVVD